MKEEENQSLKNKQIVMIKGDAVVILTSKALLLIGKKPVGRIRIVPG